MENERKCVDENVVSGNDAKTDSAFLSLLSELEKEGNLSQEQCFKIGQAFEEGKNGMQINKDEAYKWYEKSKEAGNQNPDLLLKLETWHKEKDDKAKFENLDNENQDEKTSDENNEINSKMENIDSRTQEILYETKTINPNLNEVKVKEDQILYETKELHKLYHNEFAGRLRSMQEELDRYHKIDQGRAYDDILEVIANIYNNFESLTDKVEEAEAKKGLEYLFLDIIDLLSEYGMEKYKSHPGDRRNPTRCKINGRIPTDDETKHDTIAKSYNAGFFIGNRVVVKERVDIYIYEKMLANSIDKNENEIV